MPESVASAELGDDGSIGEADGDGEFAGDEYTTPMWDNFQVKMNNVLAATRTQLDAANVTLDNDSDIPKLKALEGRISRLKTDFFHYSEAYHKITTEEYIENDDNLFFNIQTIIAKLEELQQQIQQLLAGKTETNNIIQELAADRAATRQQLEALKWN